MRYLPHTDADRQTMLATIGIKDVSELFSDVPPQANLTEALDLPGHV
nr:glycine dehydrogenase [Alphaproteobacteria bacterium]